MLWVKVELPSKGDERGGHQREQVALEADPQLLGHAHFEGDLVVTSRSGEKNGKSHVRRFINGVNVQSNSWSNLKVSTRCLRYLLSEGNKR